MNTLFKSSLSLAFLLTIIFFNTASADDGYDLWLKYNKVGNQALLEKYSQAISSIIVLDKSKTCRIIQKELSANLPKLLAKPVPLKRMIIAGAVVIGKSNHPLIKKSRCAKQLGALNNEGYLIKSTKINGKQCILITAKKDIGLLYGSFHFLRLIQTQQEIDNLNIASQPKIQYRILNHWDNLDGIVERGYAGKSLWKWNDLPDKIDKRYFDYARANASIGVNGTVINNVNANPNILRPEYLKKAAKLADIFRPYGIRVFLSANFSAPISAEFAIEQNRKGGIGDLKTSNPTDPSVQQWWKNKVKEIYKYIPDFGGFLVKANSEGMPGPQDYNKTHAEGANMLAEALQPYKGIVMWRAFVYDADVDPDRSKRSYKEFVPLDSQFLPNIFVQAKNGPIDFQPREPIQPLFGAMPKTPLMLEIQLTQEYLGHSKHLVYLAPMWKEYLEFDTYAKGPGSTLASIIDGTLHQYKMTGIAGVTNIGNDRNWCGHFFAQANWYTYGRLAWDHSLTAEQIADEWITMSLTKNQDVLKIVRSIMMGSWEACINYMTPLGLHHIMQEGFHYGPEPSLGKGREDWRSTYYHRADSVGLGYNRSSTGSDAVSQYFSPLRETFDNIETCPEKYLLWFHHAAWDHKLRSGKTLWEELRAKYYSGTNYVNEMIEKWSSVKTYIDPDIFMHVQARLDTQKTDAGIWRDTCLQYFQGFSKKPIITAE
ncbi:MAG: alpha-glucuronidase [Bacteroidetes bacterium]|nr:alpha-glucuronidase [Bacteroidota bacterium]